MHRPIGPAPTLTPFTRQPDQPDRIEIDDHRDTARVSTWVKPAWPPPRRPSGSSSSWATRSSSSPVRVPPRASPTPPTPRPAPTSDQPSRRGRPTSCSRSTHPTTPRSPPLRDGATLVGLISPALKPELRREAVRPPDHRAGDGRGAADLAGAVAGRAVVDGQHRRLPRRGRGRRTPSAGSSPVR